MADQGQFERLASVAQEKFDAYMGGDGAPFNPSSIANLALREALDEASDATLGIVVSERPHLMHFALEASSIPSPRLTLRKMVVEAIVFEIGKAIDFSKVSPSNLGAFWESDIPEHMRAAVDLVADRSAATVGG